MTDLYKDERGATAITFGLLLSVMMTAIGVAVDISRVMSSDARLQDVVDSAALAGAVAADDTLAARLRVVENALELNAAGEFGDIVGTSTIRFDDIRREVVVRTNYTEPMLFAPFIGRESMDLSKTVRVAYRDIKIVPVSVALALDASGSMHRDIEANRRSDEPGFTGNSKMTALKGAVEVLFTEIESAADGTTYLENALRTGLAAYNDSLVALSRFDRGRSHLTTTLEALQPDGSTDSSVAMREIYPDFLDDRDFRTANDPRFVLGDLREYAVLMTDGDNKTANADPDTLQLCADMRADGIEIYTVAFAAPAKGRQLMLDCASWDADADLPRGQRGATDRGCGAPGQENCDEGMHAPAKSRYFFDATDADEMREAFAAIGRDISRNTGRVRIKQ